MILRLTLASICFALASSAATAPAAMLAWDGENSNDWHDFVNWNPDGDPIAGGAYNQELSILSGSTVASVNVNIQGNGSVTVDGGDVLWAGRFHSIGNVTQGTFNVVNGSFTRNISTTLSRSFNVGNGVGGDGLINQSGGTVDILGSDPDMKIANAANSSGEYRISGGTLTVAGAILNGSGGAGKFHVIGDDGVINAGSYTQTALSTLELEINGVSPIHTTGGATLAGTLAVEFLAAPSVGQTFTILDYDGSRSGTFTTFDNVVDSPYGPDSVTLSINYGTGSNSAVVLTVDAVAVPEPSSAVLAMLAVAATALPRRRSSR
jgi:hypothetical protein